MAQFARPESDIADGVWSASSGSDRYAMIDEITPSDSDYIYGDVSGGAYCEVALSSVDNPESAIDHVVRVRGDTDWLNPETLTTTLMQGGSQIAEWNDTIEDDGPQTFTHTLSAGEANSITDYSDLRLRFEATTSVTEIYHVQWAEFECPDAAANYEIVGVTKDKDGNTLGTCECFLYKLNVGEDDATFIAHDQSDVSGNYVFGGIEDQDARYLVIAWKDGSPNVFDCTDHVLVPTEE
jgi:hypothetical protein